MSRFALLLAAAAFAFFCPPDKNGLWFRFKGKELALQHPMRSENTRFLPRGRYTKAQLDTMSNCYFAGRNYVEIIRQDHPTHPKLGVAMGFEFDENNGEYPYTPAQAVLQLKDFGWGGVEFDPRDTFNYTGVSNAVSDDLHIEVDSFRNETIYGRFSGLLLSGSDQMAELGQGAFAVKLYRK
jgi:hypothetical protein